jgi:hypothetical protein
MTAETITTPDSTDSADSDRAPLIAHIARPDDPDVGLCGASLTSAGPAPVMSDRCVVCADLWQWLR